MQRMVLGREPDHGAMFLKLARVTHRNTNATAARPSTSLPDEGDCRPAVSVLLD